MKPSLLWQRWKTIDRAVWMTAAGGAAVAAGALARWPAHPSAARSWIIEGELVPVEQVFAIDLLVRLAIFLIGVLAITFALQRRSTLVRMRLAWSLPAIIVAYPCWVNQFQAERMAERELLYRQMNRVADDMDANLFEQQVDWRAWQVISPDVAADLSLIQAPLRIWYPGMFAPAHAHELLENVLGLGPAFVGFVRARHFGLLVGGTILLLCGLHLLHRKDGSPRGSGFGWGAKLTALLLLAPLTSRAVAEYHLVAGEHTSRQGDTDSALEHLHQARRWKPALGHSWSYYGKVGELIQLQDRLFALEPLLAQARSAIILKQPEVAVEHLREARTRHAGNPSVLRFLAIALAESGIAAFNRGQIGLAGEYWRESLAYVPIDPLPWYGLSLIQTRSKLHHEAARSLDQTGRLLGYLGYRRLPVRSQAWVARSWGAFQSGDLTLAQEAYGRSLRPGSW